MTRLFPRVSALLCGSFLLCTTAAAGLEDMLNSAGSMLESGGSAVGVSGKGAGLSNKQIGKGLKQALRVGSDRAVAILGKPGGFLDDSSVRIPLPESLDTVGKTLRSVGQGKYVDEFETTVNRAAEKAVTKSLPIVKKTIRKMSLKDVKGILNGGDTAATDYLRERAGKDLAEAVKPVVSEATDQAGATSAYKNLVEQGGQYASGLVGKLGGLLGDKQPSSLDLDDYVTDKTLDGLFSKLAAEEKAIREDPVARSTDLLKKVFE